MTPVRPDAVLCRHVGSAWLATAVVFAVPGVPVPGLLTCLLAGTTIGLIGAVAENHDDQEPANR